MVEAVEILEILRKNTNNIDVESLELETNLTEQGLDSLDLISTLFAIEEKYKVKISEEDIEAGKFRSINQILQSLRERILNDI